MDLNSLAGMQKIHVLWIGIAEPTQQDMERIKDFLLEHPNPKSVTGVAVSPDTVCETRADD